MTKKEIQNQLDEIYNHIFTNYEENKCINILNSIDEIQNKIDDL
jgi:flagellin-specific chaperone FliS